jgi:hypothetical protein
MAANARLSFCCARNRGTFRIRRIGRLGTPWRCDDHAAGVYPPQRRVIILPGPDQAANQDRGHWGGGLFDFFGQNHSDGDHWSQDHWNNDWHGSHDWHD